MAKRGPDPLPAEDVRQVRVSVYLTDAEAAELDERRGSVGRGAWLRRAGLGQQPRGAVPPVNRQAWAELARLAGNLNQHQRAVNEGQAPPPGVDLAELRGAVDRLRNELLGVPGEGQD
ncbi:mobilization protein [Halospina sp. K52047b]|uniref:plasmid mobilization protein n=1 Tax=Halospina sp. K52047b TaxID=2614160 RepID=UPI00124A5169|nr:mobilization protein [Halospina sp. K52047b]KAA8976707.1 mobilization protein [Halospina sp. K52047b]